jgi:hypothetical protein
MATINGTFNSLIAGTLSGTVATPGATGPAGPAGPAGPTGAQGVPGVGVPVGGSTGQVLAKVDGVDYNTEWVDQSAPDFISSVSSPLAVTSGNLTVNLAGYATETFVTSQGYITSAALSPYLLSSTAASTYQTIAGMAAYAQLSGATFTGNVFAPTPSPGTDSTQIATTAWVKGFDYAPTNSPTLTGNPKSVTPSLSDDDTSIATTAFVKGQGYLTSAPVTSVAGRTGAITLAVADVSGAAPLASPTFTGLSTFNNIGDYAIRIPGSGTGYDMRLFDQGILIRNNLNEVILINSTGIKYPDGVTQTVAYPGPSGFLLKADNLSGLANTLTARTNLGLGTMSTATASDYSTTTVANGLYYPLSSNPSSYLVAADIAGKANLSGATFSGKVNFTPVSGVAGLNIGIGGTDVASNTAGDMWVTTSGTTLNYRDGQGTWRIVASRNLSNQFTSPQIVQTPAGTIAAALRITQLGTGNALVVEDGSSQNPDTDAFVVDTHGNVGVGVNSTTFTATSKVEVIGNIKATTLSTGSGPTFSIDSTAAHTGGSDTLDALVTINGVQYRIALRPA